MPLFQSFIFLHISCSVNGSILLISSRVLVELMEKFPSKAGISKSLPALEILQALENSYSIPARSKLDTQYKQVFCFGLLVRAIK